MPDIASNLQIVRDRIARAAERSGRSEVDVTLVAVTKTVPIERIREAIASGITHMGENRVQESEAKFAARGTTLRTEVKGLRTESDRTANRSVLSPQTSVLSRQDITLHMIGTLQRNKSKRAATLFDWIQSIDRPEFAYDLERALAADNPTRQLPVLIEMNLTGEPSKSGIAKEELPRLADTLASCHQLQGMGLMTIARLGATESELRHTFATLRHLLEDLKRAHPQGHWQHLSMGMTDDYEIAIEEGATIIRLGRAIFGQRNVKRDARITLQESL